MRKIFPIILQAAMALVTGAAAAQPAYPVKPIRLIVPFPPGGGIDLVARPLAQMLAKSLGQPVVVDNRGGAGGMVGTEAAAKSAPDGYTLLLGDAGSLTINPAVYKTVPYQVLQDFAPVTLLVSAPSVLAINPSVRASSISELVALSKKGDLNYGSAGNGSISHLIMEAFKASSGARLTHVPYKGAQVFTGIVAGEVQMTAGSQLGITPFINSGQVKALAVTSRQRSSALPNVPTVAESGMPGFEASNWFGVLAPKGTPKDIIDRLNRELTTIIRSPEMRQRLASGGSDPLGVGPEEFAEFIRTDLKRWEQIAKESGAKID